MCKCQQLIQRKFEVSEPGAMISLVNSMRKFQEEFAFPVGNLFFVGEVCATSEH